MNKANRDITKGIILAGGSGSRMYPASQAVCKQLFPVYDKPLIYYPLSTLIQLGIRDLLLISTPMDVPRFRELLGDGSRLGIRISYETQAAPEGIAQALLIGERFIGRDNVALILGDNIFYGDHDFRADAAAFDGGALVYAYYVNDPSRYGVITLDHSGRPMEIEEKPEAPRSPLVVTGLYLYDASAVEIARSLRPSARNEYEISDVNRRYLEAGRLKVVQLGRGIAWLDTGTHESLLEAGEFIATIERRQGLKVGCIEEVAYRAGSISKDKLAALVRTLPAGAYRQYLETVVSESHG